MRLPLTAVTAALTAALVLAWPGGTRGRGTDGARLAAATPVAASPASAPSEPEAAAEAAAAPAAAPASRGSEERATTGGRENVILARAVLRAPAPTPGPQPAAPATHAAGSSSTGWAALDAAISRIPYYVAGVARWHVADKGAWGMTVFATGDIYIAPRTPADKLVSVVKHEWAHALTSRIYGGFVGATAAADRHFAQSGVPAFEVEADCMALVEGATWTWYSSCGNAHWRADALALLQSRRLT